MRQILLDTETTGLDPAEGHRIIEVGCLELIDRKLTGRSFHRYINPDREVDSGAIAVHGITNEFLADKPRFREIAADLFTFLDGAQLVIHNAAFDMGFLNHEYGLLSGYQRLETSCTVLDTLTLARKLHPGQKNNLDALCKRYDIDNSHRDFHGALLDAGILADVYLAMTGGQTAMVLGVAKDDEQRAGEVAGATIQRRESTAPALRVICADPDELDRHTRRLAKIDKESQGKTLFRQLTPTDA